MKQTVALAVCLVLAAILTSSAAMALTGYDYYIGIDISNNSSQPITTRVAVPINSKALIDNYYMKSDASDIALSNGAEDHIMARNLTSNNVSWYTDILTIPASSTTRLNLWLSNQSATRDQQWIASSNDTISIADDDSLDITGNLTIQGNFYFDDIPSGNVTLLEKENAYWLKLGGNNTLTGGANIGDTLSSCSSTSDGQTYNASGGNTISVFDDGTTMSVGRGINASLSELQETSDSGSLMHGGERRGGLRVNRFAGLVSRADFFLAKQGNPTGTGYARVRDCSDDSVIGTLGSIDVSTLGTAYSWHIFNSSSVVVPTNTDVYIAFEYDGGDASNCPKIAHTNSDLSSWAIRAWYDGANWTDDETRDTCFRVYYDGYIVRRSYVYFDTASIPDAATLTGATLRIYGDYDGSTTDFDLVVQSGMPTYPHDPLETDDHYLSNYSGNGGAINSSIWSTSGYNDITLNSTGLGWIDKTGNTILALSSSREINEDTCSGDEYVRFHTTEEIGTDKDPQLVVTYDWPRETTATVAEDTQYSVKLTYDKSYLRLYINSVQQDSIAATDDIAVTATNITLLDFDGRANDLKIGNTSINSPTWCLNYTFESTSITSNTIIDQSVASNNATYTLADNPTGITVTVAEVLGVEEAEAEYESEDVYTGLWLGDAPDAPTNPYGPDTEDWGDLPGAAVLEDLVIGSGTDSTDRIPLSFVWLMLIMIGLVAVGYLTFAATQHTLPVMIIVTIGLAFCAAAIPSFGWWLLIPYIIVGVTALIMERQVNF